MRHQSRVGRLLCCFGVGLLALAVACQQEESGDDALAAESPAASPALSTAAATKDGAPKLRPGESEKHGLYFVPPPGFSVEAGDEERGGRSFRSVGVRTQDVQTSGTFSAPLDAKPPPPLAEYATAFRDKTAAGVAGLIDKATAAGRQATVTFTPWEEVPRTFRGDKSAGMRTVQELALDGRTLRSTFELHAVVLGGKRGFLTLVYPAAADLPATLQAWSDSLRMPPTDAPSKN
jgi:hypothetical protein